MQKKKEIRLKYFVPFNSALFAYLWQIGSRVLFLALLRGGFQKLLSSYVEVLLIAKLQTIRSSKTHHAKINHEGVQVVLYHTEGIHPWTPININYSTFFQKIHPTRVDPVIAFTRISSTIFIEDIFKNSSIVMRGNIDHF